MRHNQNQDAEKSIFSFMESMTKDLCKLVGSNRDRINMLRNDMNDVYSKHLNIAKESTGTSKANASSIVSLLPPSETSPNKGRLKPRYQMKK